MAHRPCIIIIIAVIVVTMVDLAHIHIYDTWCGVNRLIDAFTKFRIVSLVAHLIRTNFDRVTGVRNEILSAKL